MCPLKPNLLSLLRYAFVLVIFTNAPVHCTRIHFSLLNIILIKNALSLSIFLQVLCYRGAGSRRRWNDDEVMIVLTDNVKDEVRFKVPVQVVHPYVSGCVRDTFFILKSLNNLNIFSFWYIPNRQYHSPYWQQDLFV